MKGVNEVVVDVLAELVQRSPTDMARVEAAIEDVLAGQAWTLLMDSKPRKRRLKRRHWLCTILGDVAAMLDELADIPGAIGDAVYDGCRDSGWGSLRSRAVAEIVERLAQFAFGQALAPVATLALKVRIAALMVCPDTENHDDLTHPFARDLYDALDMGT